MKILTSIKSILYQFRWLVVALIVVGGGYMLYKKYGAKPTKELYKTQKPTIKDINQVVNATGILEIKDTYKIGSIEAGTIKELHVKENDTVVAGQVLAVIDNGRDLTEVKKAEAEVARARATLTYQSAHFEREKKLFQFGQISRDAFEADQQALDVAKAVLELSEAQLARQNLDYANTQIKAPAAGTVTSVGITKGERISQALERTLFEIAPDLTKMQAVLEIDESDVGVIKPGLKVNITVDTYSSKKFKGLICDISYSPKKKPGDSISYYKTLVEVDNSEHLLRPGMNVNACVKIKKAKQAVTITNQGFYINDEYLEKVAKQLGLSFSKIDAKEKKLQIKNQAVGERKYVWLHKDNGFIETPVTVQLTDDTNFAISEGLTKDDNIVVDVEEPNEMDAMYKKWYSGSF